MTTRSPGLARAMHVAHGVELVEDDLDLAAAGALLPIARGRPRRPARRPPRGSRPRSRSSSRMTMTSKCWAATAPSSRMSSSRRSPAAPIMPIREVLARSGCPAFCVGVALDEVAEHPHAGRVVAVVDEDVDVVDVDEVHAAGGEVVGRRERAQALADVVQRGPGGERRAGRGQGVGDVEPRRAAERRGQQVGPRELHAAPAVLDDDHLAACRSARARRRGHRGGSSRRRTRAPRCRARPSRTRRCRRSSGGACCARAGRRR